MKYFRKLIFKMAFCLMIAPLVMAQTPTRLSCEGLAHELAQSYNVRFSGDGHELANWTGHLHRAREIRALLQRLNVMAPFYRLDNGGLNFESLAYSFFDRVENPWDFVGTALRYLALEAAPALSQGDWHIQLQGDGLVEPIGLRSLLDRDALVDSAREFQCGETQRLFEGAIPSQARQEFNLDLVLADICSYLDSEPAISDPSFAVQCEQFHRMRQDYQSTLCVDAPGSRRDGPTIRCVSFNQTKENIMRVIARNIMTQRQATLPSDIPIRSAAFWQHEYECYRLSRFSHVGRGDMLRDYLAGHYLDSAPGAPSPRFRICDRTPRGRVQTEMSCYSAPLRDYVSSGHGVPTLTSVLANSTDVNHAFEARRDFIQRGLSQGRCAIFNAAELDALTDSDLERIPRAADENRVGDYIHVNRTPDFGTGAL